MKKMLGFIGLAMLVCGIILEGIWRKQSLSNATYDNAGPGYYLALPGLVLLIIGSRGYWKKIFIGIIWFFVFSVIAVILNLIVDSFIQSDAVVGKIFGLLQISAFILSVWGTITEKLPGTKNI